MSGYKLTANQGRTVLNPRHVTRVVLDDEEKRGSATGERVYRVLAYQGDEYAFALDAPSLPSGKHGTRDGWGTRETAELILEYAGDLITEASQ